MVGLLFLLQSLEGAGERDKTCHVFLSSFLHEETQCLGGMSFSCFFLFKKRRRKKKQEKHLIFCVVLCGTINNTETVQCRKESKPKGTQRRGEGGTTTTTDDECRPRPVQASREIRSECKSHWWVTSIKQSKANWASQEPKILSSKISFRPSFNSGR